MKFFCDDNLGRLAKWLRTLGYDTLFFDEISDNELVSKALKEDRIILTRDTKLVELKVVSKYLLIQSDIPLKQLKQVKEKFNLETSEEKLFTRCPVCNTPLVKIEKEKVKDKVPTYVYKTQLNFVFCKRCNKIFWSATHVERMKHRLKENSILD